MLHPGLFLAAGLILAGPETPAPAPAPPRSLDARLVLEQVASDPGIVTPTGLTVDGRGRVLVIESHTHFRPKDYQGPPADRIRVFQRTPQGDRYECAGTFFEGTKLTMNLAIARDGAVFVASRSALYRLEDKDGDGRADGEAATRVPAPIVRLDTPGDYPHNGLSGFAFDASGHVYFGLGENLGADYRLIGSDGCTLAGGGEGGNIYRCRFDGSALERIATGFWNPFHVAFDTFGRLFAVDNDPDSRPPCRLLHIVDEGDYGYRFRNGRKGLHPFTAWNGELPGTLGMVAGTGEAPSGVVAYESDGLPDDLRGSLLVTSWGDHRIERFKLQERGASFRSTLDPLIVGGEDFRPVGIAVAPDGSVFFSDWVDKSYTLHGKGRIWRIRSRTPSLRTAPASAADSLAHPDRRVRESSARELAGQGEKGLAVLIEVARTHGDARARACAIEALAADGRIHGELARELLHGKSADVRALVVRLVGSTAIDLKHVAASDDSPLVRAEALRRLSDKEARDVLLGPLESEDPFLKQAAREGMRKSLDLSELIRLAASDKPARRLAALLLLRESGRSEARPLIPKLLNDADPTIRFATVQWIGEQRLVALRPKLLDVLSTGASTKELFEATLAALELLDRERRGPRDEVSGEELIAALLSNPSTSPSVARRALRMLRPDHPVLNPALFNRLFAVPDESLRLETVRALAASSLARKYDWLAGLSEDASSSVDFRAEAVAGLADDVVRQRARLLTLAASDQPVLRREALRDLRGVTLADSERDRLAAAAGGDAESLAQLDLLKSNASAPSRSLVESEDRKVAPVDLDAWVARLEGDADAAAGSRVFFHAKGPGCFRCHQVEGKGGRAGPDLSTLADGMTRHRLIQSILQPSIEIAPLFVPWSVAKTDGTVFNGLLVGETPDGTMTFADSQGRLINVKSGDIEERKPQATSIMPDDLHRTMTLQEFRDLLSYLASRKP